MSAVRLDGEFRRPALALWIDTNLVGVSIQLVNAQGSSPLFRAVGESHVDGLGFLGRVYFKSAALAYVLIGNGEFFPLDLQSRMLESLLGELHFFHFDGNELPSALEPGQLLFHLVGRI